jgi:hypothetical protein
MNAGARESELLSVRFPRVFFNGVCFGSCNLSACEFLQTVRESSNFFINRLSQTHYFLKHFDIFVCYFIFYFLKRSQFISSAIQRCRLSGELCRLSVILKCSPSSDPLVLLVSSKSLIINLILPRLFFSLKV